MITLTEAQCAVLYDVLCDGHVRREMLKMAKESATVYKEEFDQETELTKQELMQRWLETVDGLIEQLSPIVETEEFFLPDHF